MDLNDLLLLAVKSGATDVHLKFGRPPVCRLDGQLVTVENWNALTAQDLESVLATVTAVNRKKEADFRATGELDIAYTSNDLTRYRVNGFLQRGAISFAFRVIPREVPTFETLRMPHGVRRLAEEHYGLILCTGATGSGKTATLASMLGHINPDAASAHRHDRGPDRDPPRGRRLHRQPARGRPRHRIVQRGAAARPPAGPPM
jgi:twitching motility protein PilT